MPLATCIDCGYPRAGLRRDQPCPECGSPPPPADAIVLAGGSAPGHPLLRLAGGMLVTGLFALLALVSWRSGSPGIMTFCFAFSAAGVGYLAWSRFSGRRHGGDVLWVIDHEAVRIRSALLSDATISLGSLGACRRIGNITGRWQRLRVVPRFLSFETTREIWLRTSRREAKQLRERIAERIGKAAQPPLWQGPNSVRSHADRPPEP